MTTLGLFSRQGGAIVAGALTLGTVFFAGFKVRDYLEAHAAPAVQADRFTRLEEKVNDMHEDLAVIMDRMGINRHSPTIPVRSSGVSGK